MPLTGSELEVPLYVRLTNGTIYRAGITGLSKSTADGLYVAKAGSTMTGVLTMVDGSQVRNSGGAATINVDGSTYSGTYYKIGGSIRYFLGADNVIWKLAPFTDAGSEDSAKAMLFYRATGNVVLGGTLTATDAIATNSAPSAINHLTRKDYVDGKITTHEAAADPHTGYQKESEKDAVNGYAGLDGTTKVPIAEVPTGTTGTTVALGNHTHTQAQSHNSPDTDSAPTSLHHTLGTGANQAATGNHTHTGTYPSVSTTITAGNGLTGGGDLSTNRTISALAANASINVAVGGLSVVSAPKWTTAQTLTLSGDIGGSVSFDGSGAISMSNTAIGAGVIVDADVATANKDGLTTVPSLRTLAYTSQAAMPGNARLDQIAAPTAAVALNNQKITGLGAPAAATDAATMGYVDSVAQGLSWKDAVRAATTTNGTLASAFQNGAVIDGVTLATGNRILLKNQTTTTENGLYTVNASGAPTRATDADTGPEIEAMSMFVLEGTTNGDTAWVCTTNAPITVGSTGLTFIQFGAGAVYTGGNGILLSGNDFSISNPDGTLTIGADTLAVASAPKWQTARSITLSGDIGGTSPTWDGTGNLTFSGVAISAGVIVDADVASANKDGAVGTPSMRTLGTGSTQAAAGDHTHAATYVPLTRSVISGNGLTGGGTLAADLTLNVVGDANLSVTADLVSVLSAPKWTTARTETLSGDVGGTASVDGSAGWTVSTTIAADAVTNTKLANMTANTIKGNNTGSAADPIDLTVAQTKTLLALNNVDNTSDVNKPVSTAADAAFFRRSSQVTGTGVTLGSTANTDYICICTAALTATLPTAVGNKNTYIIKRTGAGNVTIATTASQTIDGAANFIIDVQYQSINVVSDGSNWVIV